MKPKTDKSLRTANALGLVGNILFGLILALYVTLNFLMMVCDGGAVYINAELENDLLFYGLYLGCLNLFPILCIGLMFVIYNAFVNLIKRHILFRLPFWALLLHWHI